MLVVDFSFLFGKLRFNNGESILVTSTAHTSSPSRKGNFNALLISSPTVLFPEPAGPVTTQICWICGPEDSDSGCDGGAYKCGTWV